MKTRTFLSLCFALAAAAPLAAQSCSGANCLAISQIYGGGGNTGAQYRNDFIEIFNRGASPVSLAGFSVQYASATGTSWQVTILPSTSLSPGQYFLISEAAGANTSAPALPTPDTTGIINMSATAGQVALVSSTSALSGACPFSNTTGLDIVGFGGSSCTPSAPLLTNTTAAFRNSNGCFAGAKPSGSNGAAPPVSGFFSAAPAPRNASTTLNPCGAPATLSFSPASLPAAALGTPYSQTFTASGGSGSGYSYTYTGTLPPGFALSLAGVLSGNPGTTSGSPFLFQVTVTDSNSTTATQNYFLTINAGFACQITNTIAQIQGTGITSPFTGSTITTSGIVTALRSNGFYLQMPSPGDGDPNTSDAVFVFTSSAPSSSASIGNSVCVTGAVQEFTPDAGYGTITEISGSPAVTQLSLGNTLPAPVVLTAADFNSTGGVYQREKYEGMRVSVSSLSVIAPSQGTVDEVNATATSNGIFFGVLPGVPRPFREPGVDAYDTLSAGSPATIPVWDDNPEILRVNTTQLTGGLPIDVTTGATVANLTGVIDYKFGQYTLLTDPAASPALSVTGNVTYTAIPAPLTTDLTVGSFNLQHFYDTTDDPGSDVALTATAFANRLKKASLAIRNVINTPDILALEEVENLATAQAIAAQIDADTPSNPPHYQAFLSPGNDVSDINNAFLVKPATATVVSVTQYGKDTTYTDPTSGAQAILNDRPPLVLKATAKAAGSNQTLALTVIANHLRSLISVNDNTPSGTATNGARVRAKREAGAEFLANLVQTFQAAGDKVIVVGDLNAYQVNDGYVDVLGVIRGNPAPAGQDVIPAAAGIVNPILTDAVDIVATQQRYSDTFDGSAQVLDHLLFTQNLASLVRQVAYGRVNADFPESYRSDATRPERVSDHDPVIGYLTLPAYMAPTEVTAKTAVTGSGLTFNRATQIYSGTLTITNTSAQTIAGPITVQLINLSAGVSVVNAAALSSPGSLAPNASVTLPVQFTATGGARIGYTPKIYSGAF